MPKQEKLVGTFPFLPKQERARAKREALLESGRELFRKNGYEQTTAKDIAANAGVATGTFYRYFHDKRQLLLALLDDKINKIVPPEPDWTIADPVRNLADILSSHYCELDEIGLHHVLTELLPHDSELVHVLNKARTRLQDRILQGLQHAKTVNRTWHDLDLETVARAIVVLFENARIINNGKNDYYEVAKVIYRIASPMDTQLNEKAKEHSRR